MPKQNEPLGHRPLARRRCLQIFPTSRRTRFRRCSLRLTLSQDPTRSRERRILPPNRKRCDGRTRASGTRLIRFWKGTPSYAT